MNALRPPFTIHRIFHPTDFSQDSQVAFAHALKLALVFRAELTIMHVDPAVSPEGFEDFPRIRPTLAQWGLLPESSSKGDVTKLGIRIRKVRALASDAKQAIMHHLTASPTDLMVLATHQHEGFTRWLHHALAEPVSREMQVKTLFVPSHVEGFVSRQTGQSMADRLPGFALVQRLVQDVRSDQKGISKQERQPARLIVLLPKAQRLTKHAIAHGVRQDIDPLEAGILVGIGVG